MENKTSKKMGIWAISDRMFFFILNLQVAPFHFITNFSKVFRCHSMTFITKTNQMTKTELVFVPTSTMGHLCYYYGVTLVFLQCYYCGVTLLLMQCYCGITLLSKG
ncbi:hypothetical protein RND81_05G144100 [Saponaria officinalis]|uniref:Uncharacterized protein n=1 Tax=Saponaria officinalis TaxID=3572 RepID=A0AAW1KSP6_SAPOF